MFTFRTIIPSGHEVIGCQSEQHQCNSPQQQHPPSQRKAEVDMYGNLYPLLWVLIVAAHLHVLLAIT